jgi:hypothetical protein
MNGIPVQLPELKTNGYSLSPRDWKARMLAVDTDLMANTAYMLSKAIQAQGHRIDALPNEERPPRCWIIWLSLHPLIFERGNQRNEV